MRRWRRDGNSLEMQISGYWSLHVVLWRLFIVPLPLPINSAKRLKELSRYSLPSPNMISEEVPMSAFLLGSVSRGLSHAGWLDAKTPTFGKETGAAPPAEVAYLNSMHNSTSSKHAHLQAVGPGKQGAFGHPDRGPLPDERGPHARPEEWRDLVPSALLVRRSNHQVRSAPCSAIPSSKAFLQHSSRLYMDYAMSEGDVLPGRQVARVVESRNSDYSKGKVS